MRTPAEPKLTALARGMRKNPTREERRLWYDCLKKLPYRVNRPVIIAFVDVQSVLTTVFLANTGSAVLSAGVCEAVGLD